MCYDILNDETTSSTSVIVVSVGWWAAEILWICGKGVTDSFETSKVRPLALRERFSFCVLDMGGLVFFTLWELWVQPQVGSVAHSLPGVGLCNYFEIVCSHNDVKIETQVKLHFLTSWWSLILLGREVLCSWVYLMKCVKCVTDCCNCCSVE